MHSDEICSKTTKAIMGLKWVLLHLLVILNSTCFLLATYGDYPTAKLSSTWTTDYLEFASFSDGSILQPVLINNSNFASSSGPAVGCGFYSAETSEYSFYFVIFAARSTSGATLMSNPPIILWSANRTNPIKFNSTLHLTAYGDLVLRDAGGSLVWSTNTSGKSVRGMNISQSGNLLLYDSDFLPVWQSFDYPTDVWLPGQNLSIGKRLIASVSTTNWTAGSLYLSLTENGLFAFVEANPPQMYLKVIYKDNVRVLKSGNLFRVHDNRSNSDVVGFKSNKDGFQYMRLDSDGHLRVYVWVGGVESVADEILTESSLGNCSYPTACGNYGICSAGGQCSCPTDKNYFRQLSYQEPRLGCALVTPLSCQSSHLQLLLKLDNVSYFELVTSIANTDIESCQTACLKNCSCKASVYWYTSSTHGNCSMLSQVFSLMTNQQGLLPYNSSTFIKVQKSSTEPSPNAPGPSSPPQSESPPPTEPSPNAPGPSSPPQSESPPPSSKKKPNMILLIVGPILAASLTLFTFIICIYYRINQKNRRSQEEQEENGEEGVNSLELLPDLPKRYSYQDLMSATENFQASKRLGGGGFGSVFAGILGDGTKVAVKRLDRLGQGQKEFLAEVRTMGSVNHVNLVKLMGFCAERSHRLLVYEYMSNGSLDKWIFKKTPETALEWEIRKKIIFNIAKGLAYLHDECKKRIVHLDIKPQNILLDDKLNAKLSDFGLAKLIDGDQSHVMTQIRGTQGYMAPEWLSRKITEKADVYSFGVVMLEVVCGRKNLDYSQAEENGHLLQILKEKAEANQLLELVDKCSEDMQRNGEAAVEMMRIAIWCLHSNPARRPPMCTVVRVLEGSTAMEPISDYSFLISTHAERTPNEAVVEASNPPLASILSGAR